MEYLMTYGWAILIIAVVLAALFELGVFSGVTSGGTSCITIGGFQCTLEVLTTSGQLTFQFGQNTGNPMFNVQMGCASNSNAIGPTAAPGIDPWYIVMNNGLVGPYNPADKANALALQSSAFLTITGLPCFDVKGNPVQGNDPIGTQFTGSLWINFTGPINGYAKPAWGSGTPQYYKFGSITTQVK